MKKFGVYWQNLILGILLTALGIFFCAGNTDTLTKVVFIIIGVLMVLSNINPLIVSIKRGDTIDIIARILFIIFGFMFMFQHNTALTIIVAIIFIVFPVIKILLAEDKMAMLAVNLPELLIGVIVLIAGTGAVTQALFIVLGVALIIFGVLTVLASFYKQEVIK